MKLTAAIITKNEEQDLPRTLASLAFADQILVVDSGSTDKTTDIAKKHGAVVIGHPFASYADQRNFADNQVVEGWILSLDADVVVPEALAREISQAIEKGDTQAYFIGRINIIWGAPVVVADWGPKDDNHIWLYHTGSGRWESAVHEQYQTDMKVGQLKNTLLHYNYDTVTEYIDKINRYSDLARGKAPVSWWAGLVDFGKRYFYKLGFLAGYR
ncbi:MAG: glycosyltransferase family 2 protein, partial [Microgenomates group bacterium]